MKLNCSAIKKEHLRGADKDHLGYVRQADQGVLFLDEIGEMSLLTQTKLLRVLQEKKVTPLGSTQEYSVDFRLISATHQDLEKLVSSGQFRQDLYYRICVFPIHIPPLRDRSEDIPLLVEHYLSKYEYPSSLISNVMKELPDLLLTHIWSGNVRELENVVQRFVVMQDLKMSWKEILSQTRQSFSRDYQKESNLKLQKTMKKHITKEEVLKALEICYKHREKTAKYLGISRRKLQYLLAEMNI